MIRRPRRPRREQFQRGIYLLPSLFTVGNLFCGYYSVIATLQGEYTAAALVIGVAMVLDGLDGRIARLTNSQSEFGSALDSLADVLTFGVAPAALVFSWGMWDLDRLGWVTSFFFVACSATRLARFTVQAAHHDRRFFVGLPTPPAAAMIGALAFYAPQRVEAPFVPYLILVLVVVLSLLMISKVRYRSFKDIDLRRRQRYSLVAVLVVIFWLITTAPQTVLLLMAATYAASGPAERLWLQVRRRRSGRSPHHRESGATDSGAPEPTAGPFHGEL